MKSLPTLRDAFPKEFIDRFNNTMATKQHPNGILTDDVVNLTDDGFYMYIDVAKVYNRMGFPTQNMTNIEIGEEIAEFYIAAVEAKTSHKIGDRPRFMQVFSKQFNTPQKLLNFNIKSYMTRGDVNPNHITYAQRCDIARTLSSVSNTPLMDLFNVGTTKIIEDYVYEDAFNTKETRVRIKDPTLRMEIESQVIKFN